MNKHIELVKKWLNDTNSVTREELKANAEAANAAACAARAAAGAAAYATAVWAAEDSAYWVKRYEELTGE